jgi:hypothetical protein
MRLIVNDAACGIGMTVQICITLAFVVCSFISLGCDSDSVNGSSPYKHPLYGNWKLARFDSTEYEGEPVIWAFTNDSVTFISGFGPFPGAYRCNDFKNPKTIDVEFAILDSLIGIYKIIGTDSMQLKFGVDSVSRPNNFEIESGYQVQYFRKMRDG